MKLKFEFEMIDAKNYSPLHMGFDEPFKSEQNCRTVLKAEKEYLDRLDELQNEIRKKYESLLIDDSENKELDSSIIDSIDKEIGKIKNPSLYYT